MKYEVIVKFQDLEDQKYEYNVGDLYPREGVEASDIRLKELSTKANRRKKPLIKLVEVKDKKSKKSKAKNEEKDQGEANGTEESSGGEN